MTRTRSAPAAEPGSWRAFTRFWWLQALAQPASRCAQLAFPLVVLTTSGAGAGLVGVVGAVQHLPVFAVSLLLGGMLDHWDRRRAFVVAYAAAVPALLAVPVAAGLGASPTVGAVVLVVACAAAGSSIAFTDLCSQTVTPDLVPRDRLVTANSRMEVVYNGAQIAAPGLAGLLVQLVGGSATLVALAAVAAGCAVLAARLAPVPRAAANAAAHGPGLAAGRLAAASEAPPLPPLRTRLTGAVEGVRILFRHPVLRLLTVQGSLFNLLEQALLTLYLVHAVRTWGLSPGLVGVTITVGGVGSVVASLVFGVVGARVPPAWLLIGGMGLASVPSVLVPLVGDAGPAGAWWGGATFLLFGLGITAYNIIAVSLRQRLAPPGTLGRVTAGYRLVAFGPIALGAVVGGAAGELVGLRPALWLTAAALTASWLAFAARARTRRAELVAR